MRARCVSEMCDDDLELHVWISFEVHWALDRRPQI